VVHGLALTLDSTVRIRLPALFVPGLSPYRPLATAALIVISFPLRRAIGGRAWRSLHWATYGVFAAATVHGLAAGTDTARPWAFALYVGAVAAVAFATAWRVLTRPVRPSTTGGTRVPNRDRPLAV
jgi:sulfoxide reductase heme-binding subunit YedZ